MSVSIVKKYYKLDIIFFQFTTNQNVYQNSFDVIKSLDFRGFMLTFQCKISNETNVCNMFQCKIQMICY